MTAEPEVHRLPPPQQPADALLAFTATAPGCLALRSAMRQASLGAAAVPITLRHDWQALLVCAHALPDAADGAPPVLLSLRTPDAGQPVGQPQPDWKE